MAFPCKRNRAGVTCCFRWSACVPGRRGTPFSQRVARPAARSEVARMLRVGRYVFKPAQTSDEIEAVHRLNYHTFVRELQQYPDTGAGRLVDKFHDKNTYFIALRDDLVIGMISVHGQAPFSVASRLPDPSILSRPGVRPIEVRLLAVDPGERNSAVAYGLVAVFYEYAHANDYTDVYISGLEDRAALYEGIGFEVIGPPVPCGAARFVP